MNPMYQQPYPTWGYNPNLVQSQQQRLAEFHEVMEMVEDVEKELNNLEELILKLQSVGFDMQYIMDMQDRICEEYEDKLEECFEKKIKHDRKKKKHEMVYGMEQKPYGRRASTAGRYLR